MTTRPVLLYCFLSPLGKNPSLFYYRENKDTCIYQPVSFPSKDTCICLTYSLHSLNLHDRLIHPLRTDSSIAGDAQTMTFLLLLLLLFFFFFFFFFSSVSAVRPTPPATPNDTHALVLFRLSFDTHSLLLPNWTGPDACSSFWLGVRCSSLSSSRVRRVTALSLPSLDLRGPISSLPSSLSALRLLDLHDNRLNSTVDSLFLSPSSFPNLRLLYLSSNDLSGPIPDSLPPHLVRVDLSDNSLAGPIPLGLANLSALLTLRLQNNQLSGGVPDFSPSLRELDLSNNELAGSLPFEALTRFGAVSFRGNAALCGPSPLPNCTSDIVNPGTRTGGADITVPSNPSGSGDGHADVPRKKNNGLGPGSIVVIVLANVVALVVVSFMVAYCCSRDKGLTDGGESGKRNSYTSEQRVYANGGCDSDETSGTDRTRLVFFERKKGFELEDLLRASAEMLGKGSLGTVYKAVLDDGCTVAVKRLKDANPCGRKEFEQYMDLIGKLRHPNVMKLRAYYYAREEKLLVYDYLPNGSLHCLLHGYRDQTNLSKPERSILVTILIIYCEMYFESCLGSRGPGRIPLDWTTRISLVLGAARGLAWIHEEYNVEKIPHGNVKSSNVLLDKNGVACISDFGLSLLLNPAHAIVRLRGYRAPEQAETNRLSQEADVYAFGVMLLEVLTCRAPTSQPSPIRSRMEEDEQGVDLPRWVRSVVKEEWTAEVFDQELLRYKNIEEELVSMLHVGLACVLPHPEKRPTMNEVVKMIEDIRVEQSPLGEECDESRDSLSPSLATTEEGMA